MHAPSPLCLVWFLFAGLGAYIDPRLLGLIGIRVQELSGNHIIIFVCYPIALHHIAFLALYLIFLVRIGHVALVLVLNILGFRGYGDNLHSLALELITDVPQILTVNGYCGHQTLAVAGIGFHGSDHINIVFRVVLEYQVDFPAIAPIHSSILAIAGIAYRVGVRLTGNDLHTCGYRSLIHGGAGLAYAATNAHDAFPIGILNGRIKSILFGTFTHHAIKGEFFPRFHNGAAD